MAVGSRDLYVRVYAVFGEAGPARTMEFEAHSKEVMLVQWAHKGLKFVSGSSDGTVDIWHFQNQDWHSHKIFVMTNHKG